LRPTFHDATITRAFCFESQICRGSSYCFDVIKDFSTEIAEPKAAVRRVVGPEVWESDVWIQHQADRIYPLVNIQKAIENDHRNSEFLH
jgi:hypothetical protein